MVPPPPVPPQKYQAIILQLGSGNRFHRRRTGGSKMYEGYCMRCREHREMKSIVKAAMKNGRNAVKGVCTTCGAGMYKILPTEKAAATR